jgi:U-box domain
MDDYTCPISMDLMADPVLAEDGHMYDLAFLLKWFATTTASTVKSPKTNEPMGKTCTRPWAFHKAYAAWAAAGGHPAPVPAGPYGKVPTPGPAALPQPVLPRAPQPVLRPILQVLLNCTDVHTTTRMRLPVGLTAYPRFRDAQNFAPMTLEDRMRAWTEDDARTIVKANFTLTFPRTHRQNVHYNFKAFLTTLLKCCNGNLWEIMRVSSTIRVVAVAPMRLRLCFTINAFLFIHGVRGETLSGVLNCLTLPMLHVLAQMNNAEALVPALRTKQRAVQVLTAHFTPLCTPVTQ